MIGWPVLVDLVDMPGFNPETQRDRGDWGLRCVTNREVWWESLNKATCIDHGAMNAVNEDCTLWRCLQCGRGCFVIKAPIDRTKS